MSSEQQGRLYELQQKCDRLERELAESRTKLLNRTRQMEQFSLAAASMLSEDDEQRVFDMISKAIVEHSDYRRVLISLFTDQTPYREIIGFGGVDNAIVDRLRTIEMPKSWYDGVFEQGERIGRLSYYIPHSMKGILNQKATLFGEGPTPEEEDRWHPEDNLFVRMNDQNGEFIGVISVDESKSGLKPSDETVRPLEIFGSLIAQIIVLNRTWQAQKQLELKLHHAHKMESIGILAGGVAHDFNNILGIMIGNTELALEELPSRHTAATRLEEIRRAGMRAAGIVRQLLSFSRNTSPEARRIDAIGTITAALDFLQPTFPATIRIQRHIDCRDVTIFADPIQINQVLMNVCINASQAMEEGGVMTISVKRLALTADNAGAFPDLAAGEYLQICVEDTGHGIDPGVIDRVFDPYFTTRAVGKGSGLGLSVVHGIVKSFGGKTAVASRPGEGTSITVLIPVAEGKDAPVRQETGGITGGRERILFVDDEPAIVEMSRSMLGRLGYRVKALNDPAAALEAFRENPFDFDLIITDMTMPGMTGVRLSMAAKALRPEVPVIVCTGHNPHIDEQKATELGIAAHVMKPVNKQEMAAVIRKVLAERGARR